MNHMHALIPFSLTECLAPREVGALLSIAETEQRTVEDLVVFALRDFLTTHTSKVEAASVDAAEVA